MLLQIRIGNLLYFKEFKNKQALFHPEVSGNSLGMKNRLSSEQIFTQGKLSNIIPT